MDQQLLQMYRETVPTEDLELIPLQFLCDLFGIDYKYQSVKLSKDNSYDGMLRQRANEELYNDKRQRYHLNKKGFIKWVMQLSPSSVKEELRDDFIEYQNNVVDYLYDNAIQQENVLRQAESLRRKRDRLSKELAAENEKFVEYLNLGAAIARLGKDNKLIQQRIASGQTRLEFE